MLVKSDLKDRRYKHMLFYSNTLYIDFEKNILITRVTPCLENVPSRAACIQYNNTKTQDNKEWMKFN